MKTRGAIIRQTPGTYEVVDLELDGPRQNELQVKMVASGLCHSDDHTATGAAHVIAVDPVAFKRDSALKFGATQAVASMEEATEIARSLTNGQGADSAIVTVGVTTGEHVAQAFAAIRKAGTCVVTGLGKMMDIGVPISLIELVLYQKRLQGSLFGASSPSADIPWLIDLYVSGKLKLDELVTTTYRLDDIAQGFVDMHAGKNLRGVVLFD